jgi:hypothetical protein
MYNNIIKSEDLKIKLKGSFEWIPKFEEKKNIDKGMIVWH